MSYFTPYIDAAGLHIPTYQDILNDLIEQKQGIYGQDIYLGNDSTDYQELSIIALKIADTLEAVQIAYNNRGPVSAIGSGLDGVVKLNGLARAIATNSTVDVFIVGTPGTVINSGIVADVVGNKWNLPVVVTIPANGNLTVTATAQKLGTIQAPSGSVNKIMTPTAGWVSVTNLSAAAPGAPVETDSALKARQSISTALTSQTVLEGIIGNVINIDGVTRSRFYVNDTDGVDANGIPAHSICAVVLGGTNVKIAEAIMIKKSPGTGTYGSTSNLMYDLYGIPQTINFQRPVNSFIAFRVTITALAGYSTSVGLKIKQAIADYINSLPIGTTIYFTKLYGIADLIGDPDGDTFTITDLKMGVSGVSPLTTSNIPLAFNAMAVCNTGGSPDNITLLVN